MTKRVFRLSAAIFMLGAPLAAAVPGTPAAAADQAPAACFRFEDIRYLPASNGVPARVTASREIECNGDIRPLNVTITRNGVVVASGLGAASYRCQGTATRTYVLAGTSESETAPCG